jgi:pSer/pThr/pTyr-binding forkhead associated (FHA) protein
LIGRTGRTAGQDFAITGVAAIGAAPDSEIRIVAPGVSRKHARIVVENDQYFLEDAGATNGTFLNGGRVTREPLRHLDVITLGRDVDLIFLKRDGETPAAPAPDQITGARVQIIDGPDAGAVVDVPKGEVTFGRAPSCNVMLASGLISKVHARVQRTANQVVLQDLQSINGTFVNGGRVDSVQVLKNGDVINFAGVRSVSVAIDGPGAAMKTTIAAAISDEPAFNQEWKTRFVWAPDELAAIEAARAEAMQLAALRSAPAAEKKAAPAPLPRRTDAAKAEGAPAAAKPAAPPAPKPAAAPAKPAAAPVAPKPAAAAAKPPAAPVAPNPPAAAEPPAADVAKPSVAAPPIAPKPTPPVAPKSEGAREGVAPPAAVEAARAANPPPPPVRAAEVPVAPVTPPTPPAAAAQAQAHVAMPAGPAQAAVQDAEAAVKPGAPIPVKRDSPAADVAKPAAPPPVAQRPPPPVAAKPPTPAEAEADRTIVKVPDDDRTVVVPKTPRLSGVRLVGAGAPISVGVGTFVVGRAVGADVRLDDRQVSRSHARLVVDETSASIEDLQTVNGTLVNGKEVKARQPLRHGDTVQFGASEFKVELITT